MGNIGTAVSGLSNLHGLAKSPGLSRAAGWGGLVVSTAIDVKNPGTSTGQTLSNSAVGLITTPLGIPGAIISANYLFYTTVPMSVLNGMVDQIPGDKINADGISINNPANYDYTTDWRH